MMKDMFDVDFAVETVEYDDSEAMDGLINESLN